MVLWTWPAKEKEGGAGAVELASKGCGAEDLARSNKGNKDGAVSIADIPHATIDFALAMIDMPVAT